MIRAPCITAWAILPLAIRPYGTRTTGVSPAREAYAAIEAEVLPVDAQTTAPAPCSSACETATVIPRSLKDPVGLAASTFSQTSHPVRPDSQSERTRGVPPSPRLTREASAVMGSQSPYSASTPRQA